MASNDSVFFELFFKDHLTGPLSAASKKGIASLGGLDRAGNKLGGTLGGGLTSALSALVSPIGLVTAGVGALSVGFKSVITTGMQFEKQMSEVSAILNATADETKRLNDLAIQLGSSTSFSASEVAKMFTEIGRAGLNSKQIEDSAQAILDLAAATSTDLTRSGEIAIATLHQFGLEASTSGQVVDMLVKAANDSAVSIESLGESLKYIGPNAHAMGVSLEEILAATGALGDAGMQGSVATRALSTSLQRLAKPTKAMYATMDQLGISFFDANGDFIGLTNTVGLLEEKLAGASAEMKANVIATLFGNDAFGEMSVLLAKGSKNLRELEQGLLDTRGIARKTADVMLNNTAGSVEQLSGAIESLQLTIYNQTGGFFRSLVDLSTRFINRLSASWEKVTAPLGKVWDSITRLGEAFKGLFVALGLVDSKTDGVQMFFDYAIWGMNNLATAISLVVDGLSWVVNGFKTAINWITDLWDASKFLASNITRLFKPVGEIISGAFSFDSAKFQSGISNFQSTWRSLQNEFFASRQGEDGGTTATNTSPYASTKPATVAAKWGVNDVPGGSAAAVSKSKAADETEVVGASGSGKGIVVNIQNLIGTVSMSGMNAVEEMKQLVTKTVVDALRDVEASY